MLFIVEVLLIPFSALSETEKIKKFSSESISSMISSVSSIAGVSAVNVILNFQLIPSIISIGVNPTNGLWCYLT
jgi:hypothetical protein